MKSLKENIKALMSVDTKKFLDAGEVTVLHDDVLKIKFFTPQYGTTLVDVAEALPFWTEGRVEKGEAASVNPAIKLCHELVLYDIHPMVWNTYADYLHLHLKKILDNHYVTADFSSELTNYCSGRTRVCRLNTGDFSNAHYFANYYGLSYPETIISMLTQLNGTDDFEGGELYFPRQQLEVQLSAGEMLVFPSTYTHPVEYRKVTTGNRYLLESHIGRFPFPAQRMES